MSDWQLIYPMFAMVLLTALVLGLLFRSRVSAVQQGQVSMKFYRVYPGRNGARDSGQTRPPLH